MLDGTGRGTAARAPPGVPLFAACSRSPAAIESQTDERLQPLYREWAGADAPIAATILAALGQIELHLRRGPRPQDAPSRRSSWRSQASRGCMGADVFSTDGRRLEEVVGDLLAAIGLPHRAGGIVHRRL